MYDGYRILWNWIGLDWIVYLWWVGGFAVFYLFIYLFWIGKFEGWWGLAGWLVGKVHGK